MGCRRCAAAGWGSGRGRRFPAPHSPTFTLTTSAVVTMNLGAGGA